MQELSTGLLSYLNIQTNTVKSHFTRIMFNFITNFISVIIFILVNLLLHTYNA